jgi:hypothetical protein
MFCGPKALTKTLAATAALLACAPTSDDTTTTKSAAEMTAGVAEWLDLRATASDATARGLVHYFVNTSTGRAEDLSTLATAKSILFHLQRNRIDSARANGLALIAVQQLAQAGAAARSYGAFPSAVAVNAGHVVSNGFHYAGDNLVAIAALVALGRKTGDARFVAAARLAGRWIVDVMTQGTRFGVWAEDHGAPMNFVDAAGNFDNRIMTGVNALWLKSLAALADATGDQSFRATMKRAWAFLAKSQTAVGAYLDHYDPGYPAVAYDAARWRTFGIDGSVVADNSIRTALGALGQGDVAGARRFLAWLAPTAGGVYGYLDGATGHAKFVAGDAPYYDVVASGLLRSLAERLGETRIATLARDFLATTQSQNGGFIWGRVAATLQPIENREAALTGLWAVADIAP